MVSCKQCGVHNSLDSTFCKKCGAAINEQEIVEARAKLDELVAKGNHAFNEGRTDEALAISETVLTGDPDSIAALWLKAICHERHGEVAVALDCAERIVELNPDSDLDKIRRNQLRNKLSASLHVYEKPDRRIAMVGGIAACILVICIGILGAKTLASRSGSEVLASNAPGIVGEQQSPLLQKGPSTDQSQANQDPKNQANPNQGTSDPGVTTPGVGDVGPLGNRGANTHQSEVQAPSGSNNSASPLPRPQDGVGPITINPLPDGASQSQPNKAQVNPDQNVDPNEQFKTQTDPSAAQDNSPGQIEINVYGNGSKKNTSGASVNGNGLEAITRTANQAYLLGDFPKAASLFSQALRSGGNPVTLNQRLGQAYERMGQINDAIEAYRRAVQAGEAALAQGKPNPAGIQSAIDSSQQALKKLGG